MSGLRFFSDLMNGLIAAERRNAAVAMNAAAYAESCRHHREANLPRSGQPNSDFIASTEGLCAARIIMAGDQP